MTFSAQIENMKLLFYWNVFLHVFKLLLHCPYHMWMWFLKGKYNISERVLLRKYSISLQILFSLCVFVCVWERVKHWILPMPVPTQGCPPLVIYAKAFYPTPLQIENAPLCPDWWKWCCSHRWSLFTLTEEEDPFCSTNQVCGCRQKVFIQRALKNIDFVLLYRKTGQ